MLLLPLREYQYDNEHQRVQQHCKEQVCPVQITRAVSGAAL